MVAAVAAGAFAGALLPWQWQYLSTWNRDVVEWAASGGFTLLGTVAVLLLVPVLMTALTSGVGLVPLALAPGQPGRELLYPVATVMIGGLVTNTLLDFVVLPGLLARLPASILSRAKE